MSGRRCSGWTGILEFDDISMHIYRASQIVTGDADRLRASRTLSLIYSKGRKEPVARQLICTPCAQLLPLHSAFLTDLWRVCVLLDKVARHELPREHGSLSPGHLSEDLALELDGESARVGQLDEREYLTLGRRRSSGEN